MTIKKREDKVNDLWETAREYSAEGSKVARQLAFGEGAVFWFFFHNQYHLSAIIATGLFFLVLYFIFDLSQYLIGAWANKNLAAVYDDPNKSELRPEQITAPPSMNTPMYVCYYVKFCMLVIASIILLALFISCFLFY